MTDSDEKLEQAIAIIDEMLVALNAAWSKFPTWKEQHEAWKKAKDAALRARTFKDNMLVDMIFEKKTRFEWTPDGEPQFNSVNVQAMASADEKTPQNGTTI